MTKNILTYLLLFLGTIPLYANAGIGLSGAGHLASPNVSYPTTPKDSLNQLAITNKELSINSNSLNSKLSFPNNPFPIPNNLLPNNQLTNSSLPIPNPQIFRTFPELEETATIRTTTSNEFALYEEGLIFTNGNTTSSGMSVDSLRYYIGKASSVIKEIRKFKKFIGYLDGASLLELPVGMHTEIGGLAYDIGIASIKLKPHYAELEVYMQFTMPQNGKTLTFMGKGIKFTKEGGIVGDATLQLIGDYAINLSGGKSQIILKAGTFVTFDCSGFKKMALDADIKFSRDLLLPEDANGNPAATGNVMSSFRSEITDWNNLVVELDIQKFQLPSLLGVTFAVRSAVFDFSDTRNSTGIVFPTDYQHPDIVAGVPKLWRGFYLRELSVTLPRQFEKTDTTVRTSFAAYDVLIDNMGFTGFLEGKALIRPDEGNMSGWGYSLDSIGINIIANQIQQAGFNGEIVIPIAKKDHPFAYQALINPGNEYLFNVEAAEGMQFDIFKTSKLEIYKSSYIEIKVANERFLPKMSLSGQMTIDAALSKGESSKKVSLANIAFENLQLQTVKPYMQANAFSFGSEAAEQALASLPVSINSIGFKTISDNEIGLDFDLIVNLNESFGGEAGLTLVGNLNREQGIQKWKYKNILVNDIQIDIDQGAFKFYGKLKFYRNDTMYGNGFNGVVDATFNPGINVKATAIFGVVDNMRYWYADALATFPKAIPIIPPLGMNGFGGGAYYHMKMDTEGLGSDFGKSASGIVYVPDAKSGLGIKATIAFATMDSPTVLNGEATFEVAFFEGGGLRSISFTGNMKVVTLPDDGDMLEKIQKTTNKMATVAKKNESSMVAGLLPSDPATIKEIYGAIGEEAKEKGSISAQVKFIFDFENKSIHGNMEIFVNVAGGKIKGAGAGGKAGWAVIHYDQSDWYFYLGTPEDRIGLSAGLGAINAQLTSYFMLGTKIPGSPPPPAEVSEILGGINLDYMKDANALGLGKGLGFGATLSVSTGDLNFLMFYARFQAGLGFDIMLKNYGNDARCKGSTNPLGINGWYANGQAYAYFDGNIGIQIKLFGKNKKVDILDIQAAAILQARLPNPFWMRGIVGGRFSVLGGLVKGSCKFEVTLGKECDIVAGSVIDGISVIAEVTPQNGETDISVFNKPQAIFNMPIEQTFELVDVDDIKKKFRITLEDFSILYGTGKISTSLEWNVDNDVAALNSLDVFPSEKEITQIVQVSFEEFVAGKWVPVYVDGKKYVERSETKFTSGIAPDYIPLENVAYSYPVIGQLNFYKDEYNSGYIKLKKGQPYLFDINTNDWKQKGRFTALSTNPIEFDFSYSKENREVNFTLPTGLKTSSIYAFELANLPVRAQAKIDRNVSDETKKLGLGQTEINTEITTKKAEGTIDELQEKAIFTAYYRTSQFTSLKNKLNTADMSSQWRWPIRNGVHEIGKSFKSQEFFDNAELNGVHNQQPLIQIEAVLTKNKYYKKYIYPIVYNGYPLEGRFTIDWRTVEKMGLPPTKAVFIKQYPLTQMELGETDIQSGQYITPSLSAAFIYNLSNYYQRDMSQIQNKVANYYADSGGVNTRLQLLLTTPFPVIIKGRYEVKVKYVLPGKNITSSEQVITIVNPVD